jgi:hypothetical protein
MYIHRMVRTQLYRDETMHRRLRELARRQGRTVSDLARDALARVYGVPHGAERRRTLEAVVGLWRDRADVTDSRAYVRRLRRDTRRGRPALP